MVSFVSTTILATIAFLLFISPGFIFLRALWGGDKGFLQPNNFYSYFIWGSLASIALYPITLYVVHDLCSIRWFDQVTFPHIWESLFKTTTITTVDKKQSIETTTTITGNSRFLFDHIKELISFFGLAIIVSALLGFISWQIIYRFKLDLIIPIFKVRNEWFYLLADRRLSKTRKERFYTEIHFLCEIDKTMFIYRGIVNDYKLKDGTLEYIYIRDVWRTISPKHTQPEYNILITKDLSQISAEGSIEIKGTISMTDSSTREEQDPHKKEIIIDLYSIPAQTAVFRASEIKNISVAYKPLAPKPD